MLWRYPEYLTLFAILNRGRRPLNSLKNPNKKIPTTNKMKQSSTFCIHFTLATYNLLHYIILVKAYLNAVVYIQNSVVQSKFCDPLNYEYWIYVMQCYHNIFNKGIYAFRNLLQMLSLLFTNFRTFLRWKDASWVTGYADKYLCYLIKREFQQFCILQTQIRRLEVLVGLDLGFGSFVCVVCCVHKETCVLNSLWDRLRQRAKKC